MRLWTIGWRSTSASSGPVTTSTMELERLSASKSNSGASADPSDWVVHGEILFILIRCLTHLAADIETVFHSKRFGTVSMPGKIMEASRYLVCLLDATVWPSNGVMFNAAINMMGQVLSLSSANFAWVQCPVMQSQTSLPAVVKHQHALDNALLKCNLASGANVQVLFGKPDSTAQDTRATSQRILGVTHTNYYPDTPFNESSVIKHGVIGPLPLIKIADLLGYDETTRPGPSGRTEQPLQSHLNGFECFIFHIFS